MDNFTARTKLLILYYQQIIIINGTFLVEKAFTDYLFYDKSENNWDIKRSRKWAKDLEVLLKREYKSKAKERNV